MKSTTTKNPHLFFYSSGGQKAKDPGVSRAVFLVGTLVESLFLGLFQHLQINGIPWPMAPSSVYKAQLGNIAPRNLSLSLSLTLASIVSQNLLPPSAEDFHDYI